MFLTVLGMIPYLKINPEWKMEVAFRHDGPAFIAPFLFPVLPEDRYREIVHEAPNLLERDGKKKKTKTKNQPPNTEDSC